MESESVSKRFHLWLFGRRGLDGIDVQLMEEFLNRPVFRMRGDRGSTSGSAYDVADGGHDVEISPGELLPAECQGVSDEYVSVFNEFREEVIVGVRPLNEREIEDGEALLQAHSSTAHIIRMLHHTERKNYENYVVTGIWHRLQADGRLRDANLTVRFETQKSVKIDVDGVERDAYIDMYFPAVNIAVECDEVFHKKQTKADRKRQAAIMKEMGIRPADFFRIDASLTIMELDRQIENVVRRVVEKAIVDPKLVRDDWLCAAKRTSGWRAT